MSELELTTSQESSSRSTKWASRHGLSVMTNALCVVGRSLHPAGNLLSFLVLRLRHDCSHRAIFCAALVAKSGGAAVPAMPVWILSVHLHSHLGMQLFCFMWLWYKSLRIVLAHVVECHKLADARFPRYGFMLFRKDLGLWILKLEMHTHPSSIKPLLFCVLQIFSCFSYNTAGPGSHSAASFILTANQTGCPISLSKQSSLPQTHWWGKDVSIPHEIKLTFLFVRFCIVRCCPWWTARCSAGW